MWVKTNLNTIILCFNIFLNVIYLWYKSEFFAAITSVSWSLRNYSNLLLKKHLIFVSMLKTVVLHNILVEIKHFYLGFFDE